MNLMEALDRVGKDVYYAGEEGDVVRGILKLIIVREDRVECYIDGVNRVFSLSELSNSNDIALVVEKIDSKISALEDQLAQLRSRRQLAQLRSRRDDIVNSANKEL